MKLPLKSYEQVSKSLFSVRDAGNVRIAVDLTLEDAEAFVTACNAHDQLVEALRNAKRQLNNANKHIDCEDEIQMVSAALSAAGVE